MSLGIVILGHEQWERFTWPLVKQVQYYAPQARVIIVDNGSQPPYPTISGERIIRIENNINISAAGNLGLRAAAENDWTLFLNNDVRMTGHLPSLKTLATDCLYGPEMIGNRLVGWCVLMPERIYREVGYLDECYEFYNEVDYCQRARLAGFSVRRLALPFIHFGHGSHHLFKDVERSRAEGRKRFFEKFGVQPDAT